MLSLSSTRLYLIGARNNEIKRLCRVFGTVRLSKRMSELDICSRREADRLIQQKRVMVGSVLAEIGDKVDQGIHRDSIAILPQQGGRHSELILQGDLQDKNNLPAIVLNKPPGYVSGQAEHGHIPAAKLLTNERRWVNGEPENLSIRNLALQKGFAPAGRLDLESSGLMIFSQSGIISKKLINKATTIEKEYIVKLSPAVQETRREHKIYSKFKLPTPTLDLTPLVNGQFILLGDYEPLKPCKATWIKKGSVLRIVLTEGRKRQIRRMCRECIGYHVNELVRVRIGNIRIDGLPVGCWRPLLGKEIESILAS